MTDSLRGRPVWACDFVVGTSVIVLIDFSFCLLSCCLRPWMQSEAAWCCGSVARFCQGRAPSRSAREPEPLPPVGGQRRLELATAPTQPRGPIARTHGDLPPRR